MKDELALRIEIVEAVRLLEERGLNTGSSGNVSCRLGDAMLVTPTGASSATLTPEGVVKIDYAGNVRDGSGIPSSEWQMHSRILEAFPAAEGVVHTHADNCVALSCMRKPIPAFHYMVASFGGDDIPCSRYASFGSEALSASAVEALAGRTACLLANHGMIHYAETVSKAVAGTLKLETLARQYILALQAGEPVMLSADEMADARRRYTFYGKARMPR